MCECPRFNQYLCCYTQNLLDVVVGCLAWFVCGYAFAFGESDNSFVGSRYDLK